MYLKSLKLAGFKSFADRTRLEFRPGVTVVVGPNGSGKSNIVDAVAWVMGTQSPKSLRTDKMDDVIFAGTATRPGLGRAEVTLLLDNASGMLPLDLPEVSITRRLYRDGSSDYEINGVACRLLDIQELLSDSHVGRHQHVIIGQGQIDSVLNAGPEDHRSVIEEAAGILKHRIRKEKAIRRLERTDGDVVRLRDLLGEISRQMRPLRRQAEAAARHDAVRDEARAIRLYLTGEELRRIASRAGEIEATRIRLESAVTTAELESRALGERLAALRLAAGEVGEALDRDTTAAARLETTIERLRRIAQVAQERHRAGTARLEGAGERRRDLEHELNELSAAITQLSAETRDAEIDVERSEHAFRLAEDEERSLADQEGMSTEGAIAVVRGDLRSMEAAEERDVREAESIDRRLESIRSQRSAEAGQILSLKEEIKAVDRLVGTAQDRYSRAESRRRGLQDDWERAESDHRDAELRHARAVAKVAALEQAVEGLADPASREMLEHAIGSAGHVARLLDIPEALTAAVDAALGPWAGSVAFESAESLRSAVGGAKSAGGGGVPAIARTAHASTPAREIAERWGVETLADQLGPGRDADLAVQLLGDVVLVEGWSAAWSLVQAHPGIRAVTPEGDLVTRDGIRLSQPNGATPAMLESALIEQEAAEIALARATSLYSSARRVFDESRLDERDALESLETLEAQLAGVTEATALLERSLATLVEEEDRLTTRRSMLEATRTERVGQRRQLLARLAALEGEEAERQRMWEELTQRRREASERREAARAGWQAASSARTALEERLSLTEQRRDEVKRLLDSEDAALIDPASLDRLAIVAERAREALTACRVHLESLRDRQSDLRSRAGETGRELGEAQDAADATARAIAADREQLAQDRVEAAELRVRREAVEEALRRDLDIDADVATAAPRPELDGDEPLDGRLARLEAELRRMGPINPLAAAEFAELEERHEFLRDQLSDLEKSRDELRKVISALDGEIESQFMRAFEEIAGAFQEHFAVLFPGGTGRLRLTDPEDPLHTGVEIEAQPLGKKVAKMSLLSGGERSLAALAFLFAIFKARPSPFYILDEVEAALDDANLRRFLRLLERFRADAQLLVVTHQQQTMESADVLYGVTMEPGGSSKVVAKSLTHHAVPATGG